MVLVIPRYPVSVFRLFLKMGGWVVLVTGALVLAFTLISYFNLKTALRFEDEGRRAVAVISDKEISVRRDSDGDQKTTYWLTLDYMTGKGKSMSVRRSVSKSRYSGVSRGGELVLFYLESQPDKTELTPGSFRTGARITQRIALGAGVIWLAAFWIIGGWTVSAVRARRFGPREEAVVREVRRTGVRVNNRPRYRLVWLDAAGREGKSLLHKASDLGDLRRNDVIHIYQGLRQGWWVGDVGEREEFSR